MLGLPKSTEFNKRIPKQKFYENINVTPALKRIFVDQIKAIYWRNKIAVSTLNLAEGIIVSEIELIEIGLNSPLLDEGVLRQIDKEIPYHIMFLLEYNEKYQAWIGYKEAKVFSCNTFKVNRYYHTEWLVLDELSLKIEGLNIDTVYENFIRQIAGDKLKSIGRESLKESVELDERRQQLKKQITILEEKVRREKQLNKQMQINIELKEKRRELEDMR